MAVISRRILVPMVGKSDLALERAKRLVAILAKHGAAVRLAAVQQFPGQQPLLNPERADHDTTQYSQRKLHGCIHLDPFSGLLR